MNLRMKNLDEFWMRRCFQLAYKGVGFVSPNPLVGAVIVRNGAKLSEGFHQQYGGPHAEINAINIALANGKNIIGSTLYVNLEPCFHFGKTPPCVDAIIQQGFSRVVIATKDPNPLVSGKSIQKLKKNGINCTVGILQNEGERLNEKFFTFIKSGKPFIALKAAQTIDGFIAKVNGISKWISNDRSRKYVHQLRNEFDAILVGANTVTLDNPELTVRNINGSSNPIRVVVDGQLSVDPKSKIFNSKAATILYTSNKLSPKAQKKLTQLEKKGIIVVQLNSTNWKLRIKDIITDLSKHQIASILVEGGQKIYSEFLDAGIVDKIYLFTAKKRFGKGISTFAHNTKPVTFALYKQRSFGTDICQEYYLSNRG